ncbi:hypothetical protein GCM10010430_36550 [Kitasatospora cystarginea]|uniref:Uncharacterized protein n=1 Tax=Kitasatospora cystarginea TaxID=58350 RepID=A0ABP5R3J7_9ACTN
MLLPVRGMRRSPNRGCRCFTPPCQRKLRGSFRRALGPAPSAARGIGHPAPGVRPKPVGRRPAHPIAPRTLPRSGARTAATGLRSAHCPWWWETAAARKPRPAPRHLSRSGGRGIPTVLVKGLGREAPGTAPG